MKNGWLGGWLIFVGVGGGGCWRVGGFLGGEVGVFWGWGFRGVRGAGRGRVFFFPKKSPLPPNCFVPVFGTHNSCS